MAEDVEEIDVDEEEEEIEQGELSTFKAVLTELTHKSYSCMVRPKKKMFVSCNPTYPIFLALPEIFL